eukprot:TRINITY_DN1113_c0_g1_i1.p1 TRINITY_DN1113_c0_g1~~TRINITY_DN1113_c0_g1_i1.p1  ORF type:complete len:153 (+),score=26.72 TRINITY_DN1113_c0_g1_i1:58-459(+)
MEGIVAPGMPDHAESDHPTDELEATMASECSIQIEPGPARRGKPSFWARLRGSFYENQRSALQSLFLFVVGIVLVGIGLHCLLTCDPSTHGFIFITPGGLAFLPGAYGVFVFLMHARQHSGYDPRNLPRWERV